jgi:hypothetical protein
VSVFFDDADPVRIPKRLDNTAWSVRAFNVDAKFLGSVAVRGEQPGIQQFELTI